MRYILSIFICLSLFIGINVEGKEKPKKEKKLEIYLIMPDYKKLEKIDESKVNKKAIKTDRRFLMEINDDNYDQIVHEYFDVVDEYIKNFPAKFKVKDFSYMEKMPEITPDPDDPRVMYVAIEGVDPQTYIDFAVENNKEELYIIFENAPYKGKKEAFFKDALSTVMDVLYPQAYAHNNVPNRNNVSYDREYRTGACFNKYLPEDNTSDGRRPYMKICFFESSWLKYMYQMYFHISRNIAWYDTGSQKSLVDCFNDNNNTVSMKNPVGLEIQVKDIVYCPHTVCGCTINSRRLTSPRTSFDKISEVSLSASCRVIDEWSTVRHEVAHAYAYRHCDMEENTDSIGRCMGKVYTGIPKCEDPNQPNGTYIYRYSPDLRHY